MASQYLISNSGGPSASFPTIYFIVNKVTRTSTIEFQQMKRPNSDIRTRGRAGQVRRIVIEGYLAKTADAGQFGIDTGAGLNEVDGKRMEEALEVAVTTWKNSGTTTLYIGTDSTNAARGFAGFIENVTYGWEPATDDGTFDNTKAVGQKFPESRRKFVLSFIIGTVT